MVKTYKLRDIVQNWKKANVLQVSMSHDIVVIKIK